MVLPPELSGNLTSSHIISEGGGTGEGNDDFGLMKYLCSYFEGIFNMP
jgi:hypothetical protein